MAILTNPNSIKFPFSFSGVCPYRDCASELPRWTANEKKDLDELYCPNCGRKIQLSENGKTINSNRIRTYDTQDGGRASVKTEGVNVIWIERLSNSSGEDVYTFDRDTTMAIIRAFEYRENEFHFDSLSKKLPGLIKDREHLAADDCSAIINLLKSAIKEIEHPAATRR